MKTEDFNRLKQICEKEGFELSLDAIEGYNQDYVFRVSKKDIWEGVEFVECVTEFSNCLDPKKGQIYKVITKKDDHIYLNCFNGGIDKIIFKPSTEQAYIEQLKKEAFERFGDIKEGDRFELNDSIVTIDYGVGFYYFKAMDKLNYNGWTIYQQGKWATKIEKVEVRIKDNYMNCGEYHIEFYLKNADKLYNKKKSK